MNKILWTSLIILVLAGGVVFFLSKGEKSDQSGAVESEVTSQEALDQEAVRKVVTEFGDKMEMVSLTADSEQVRSALDQAYGSLVTPELLALWKAAPSNAPGRMTSSPWPDRIEIYSTTKNTDGSYTVQGNVIEITSAEMGTSDAAAIYNVELRLENRGGTWLISSFTKGISVGEKL